MCTTSKAFNKAVAITMFNKDVPIPTRAHEYDGGLDLHIPEFTSIPSFGIKRIPLGFGIAIPKSFVGFMEIRSSLGLAGLIMTSPVIDAGYRGECHLVVFNASPDDIRLQAHSRVGQLLILNISLATPIEVEELPAGIDKRVGGFGTTGK
jgi:dUTP pyrophosphatase